MLATDVLLPLAAAVAGFIGTMAVAQIGFAMLHMIGQK